MTNIFKGASGVPFCYAAKISILSKHMKWCCQKGGKSDCSFNYALGVKRECFLHRPFFVLCSCSIIVANVNLNKQEVLNYKVRTYIRISLGTLVWNCKTALKSIGGF